MKRTVTLMLICLALPLQAALPDPVRDLAREWRPLGKGEMHWLGMSLYEASLWVSGERFSDSEPYALMLRYTRSIPGSRLTSSTISEMKRLGWRDEAQLKRWKEALNRIFPDVKPGETIVGVNMAGQGARFFHQGHDVGEVIDPDFSRAFFAIWLDAGTRAPALREALLGKP
jgi:hypothetical protein